MIRFLHMVALLIILMCTQTLMAQIPLSPLPSENATAPEISSETVPEPEYSQLSKKAERHKRLDGLFARLAHIKEASTAEFIAEEIWALWLDSGSANINLLLERAINAQKQKDNVTARRLLDYVTAFAPEFAEGWSRSAHLAVKENDINRALQDCTQALILEPRHFFSLWTLGNIFEKLDHLEPALMAYEEAYRLYPAHTKNAQHRDLLRKRLNGQIL